MGPKTATNNEPHYIPKWAMQKDNNSGTTTTYTIRFSFYQDDTGEWIYIDPASKGTLWEKSKYASL